MPGKATEREIRRAITEAYRALARLGMNLGSTGNIGVRYGSRMLIAPTGCNEETLRPADVVLANFDRSSRAALRPSSEWPMHAVVYARIGGVHAMIHTHADHCVALSCLRKPIPAFHFMIRSFGRNDVPCVSYRPFGTHELGGAAARALKGRTACVLANHGMLSLGKTIRAAFDAAGQLEAMAKQYLTALAVGKPVLLTDREMAVVARQFADYGHQPGQRPGHAGLCHRMPPHGETEQPN